MARRRTLGWRKILLGIGCAGVTATGVCLTHGLDGAAGRLAAAPPTATAPVQSATSNEYSSSMVATFGETHLGITREELGEYLIARFGEKVEHLINRRIIEDACKAHGIEVTAAEVENKLAEDLKDLSIDRSRFVKDFLKARHKTLYEWKEDNLRVQLMMMKLCQDRLTVSDEEVRNAYESRYGEKVDCRVIQWPKEQKSEAEATYLRLLENEDAFAEAARKQKEPALAATGGKIKAFGRHTLENKELEDNAFALRPGQVSPLIEVPDGFVVIKCDQRLQANTTIPFEKVKDELLHEVRERKAQKVELPKLFKELQDNAKAKCLIERKPSDEQPPDWVRDAPPGEAGNRPVAYLYDGQTVLTRADLGEYLIQRYGPTNLEMLVNKRIIENACQAKGITVTDAEVEADFLRECAKQKLGRKEFIQQVLGPNKVSVFVYKEDVLRPRLQLAQLCGDRVKVEEKDLKAAFEAYHGEKVECRMILWPRNADEKLVFQEYGRIRDNVKAFDETARSQASAVLARNEGRLDHPIARHTTGNDELEKAAFSLQPGEVSNVLGTPEGMVVLKCVRRLPADKKPEEMESCREELTPEIIEKKTQAEMPILFLELSKQADPHFQLKDPNKGESLTEEVLKTLAQPSAPK